MRYFLTALLGVLLVSSAVAQDETYEVGEYEAWAAEFEASLDRQTGIISIIGGQVQLNVPEEYYYLSKEDARAVLEDAWGNPPDDSIDGMLFPAEYSPLDPISWGTVLTFIDDGYVSDEDADDMDYTALMKQMKKDTDAENKERQKQGYETVELVGWAEEPVYDATSHKFYWAKELRFEGVEQNTLNYDVRALGRYGMLRMNFVASIDQLGEIKEALPTVLGMVTFTEGNRYADYQPGDKTADYGLAAIVAGGAGLALAKKSGLLAVILITLKKFGIYILIGAGALIAWARRAFSGNSQ